MGIAEEGEDEDIKTRFDIDEDSIEMSELGRKLVRWGCVDKKQKKGHL